MIRFTGILMRSESPEIAQQSRASKRASETVEIGENIFEAGSRQRSGASSDSETENVDFSDRVVDLVQPNRGQEDEEAAAQDAVHKLISEKSERLVTDSLTKIKLLKRFLQPFLIT